MRDSTLVTQIHYAAFLINSVLLKPELFQLVIIHQ